MGRLDEKVRAVALLQLPHCAEKVLSSLLLRAEYRIDVWAVDRAPYEEHTNPSREPAKELVYSTTVSRLGDPVVLAQQSDDDAADPTLILAWELDVVLHRPRVRLQDPSIYVQSAFIVSASSPDTAGQVNNLEPFKLQEPNIFEPMRNIRGLGSRAPYLAASRLQPVRPSTPKTQKQFRAEHTSPGYRMVAAVMTRMKYTRMSNTSLVPTIIASLDIEVIPIVELRATIESSNLAMANGQVEDLMPRALPMELRSRDFISLLFRLRPHRIPSVVASPITPGALNNTDVLSLAITVRVMISESCQPLIQMEWTTNVDFFQALNLSYGTPSQPIQRTNRPSSLALGNSNGRGSQSLSTSLQPVLNPATANEVTISFTAPDKPVIVGQPFTWTVLVVNGSRKTKKLAIIPLPRIPRGGSQSAHFAKRHAPKSSTASFQPAERRHTQGNESDIDFAQAVVDENVVYAMQHSNATPAGTDLVALTAELRVGPLGPGKCHECAIELVAFVTGTLKVDAVRVIDLTKDAEDGVPAAGVIVDIRDLPDVVVVANIAK
jgi:TRAPP trafficking subunit Trs65